MADQASSQQNAWDGRLYLVIVGLVIVLSVVVAGITIWRVNAIFSDSSEPQIAFYITLDAEAGAAESGAGEGVDRQWVELSPEQIEAFRTDEIDIALYRVEELRAESEDAVNSAQLVLSFLEGAGFILALAAGLAAIYGFRNSREVRTELRDDNEKMQEEVQTQLKDSRDAFRQMQLVLDDRRDDLDQLPERLLRIASLEQDLEKSPDLFRYLLQAFHELQLHHYSSAYSAVMRALDIDPVNPMALYYAGWLEQYYIPGKIDEGMAHLQQAYQIDPEWPSAVAAYGAVLRQKAMSVTGSKRQRLLNQAEGQLLNALGQNPMLLDLNHESLWGPVGGIQVDREHFKPVEDRDYSNAIETYEKAARVTPGSSYPRGNLSGLYMWQYKRNPNRVEYERRALDSFEETVKLAQVELVIDPHDYFHVMDIAMAKTVLCQQRPAKHSVRDAEKALDEALGMNPSSGLLRVSVRGWDRLLEYCPDHWHDLRARLQIAQRQFIQAAEQAEAAIG